MRTYFRCFQSMNLSFLVLIMLYIQCNSVAINYKIGKKFFWHWTPLDNIGLWSFQKGNEVISTYIQALCMGAHLKLQ